MKRALWPYRVGATLLLLGATFEGLMAAAVGGGWGVLYGITAALLGFFAGDVWGMGRAVRDLDRMGL